MRCWSISGIGGDHSHCGVGIVSGQDRGSQTDGTSGIADGRLGNDVISRHPELEALAKAE